MTNRRLTLRSESLTSLTTDELAHVAGAADDAISLLGRCLETLQGLQCLLDTYQPTRCLCP